MNWDKWVIASFAGFAATAGLAVFAALLVASQPALADQGTALLTLDWSPAHGGYGILPMLFGSIFVTVIAIVIAVPLGLTSALCISELLPPRWRFPVKSALEILAGIPSIVYGLIGVAFLSVWIGDLFDLSSGRTILAGGLLLAIMILPTIITLCDDAFQNVPREYRESAAGLGLYRFEVTRDVLFPMARGDLFGACLLALGRAFGETMAVMLVVGGIDRIPAPVFNALSPGQTVTSKLGRELAEAPFGSVHFSALIVMSLILVVITLALTVLTEAFFRRKGVQDA